MDGIDAGAPAQGLGDLLDTVAAAVDQDGLDVRREPLQQRFAIRHETVDERDFVPLGLDRRAHHHVRAGEPREPIRAGGTGRSGREAFRLNRDPGVAGQAGADTLEKSRLQRAQGVQVDRIAAEGQAPALGPGADLEAGDVGPPAQVRGDLAQAVLTLGKDEHLGARFDQASRRPVDGVRVDDDDARPLLGGLVRLALRLPPVPRCRRVVVVRERSAGLVPVLRLVRDRPRRR